MVTVVSVASSGFAVGVGGKGGSIMNNKYLNHTGRIREHYHKWT